MKLRYLDRNPVRRRLVKQAKDWRWSSFRHYAFREKAVWRLNRNGRRETVSCGRQVARPGRSCSQVSAQKRMRTWGSRYDTRWS